AFAIDFVRMLQLLNEKAHKSYIISGGKAPAIIPALIEAVRIGDKKSFLIGEGIELRELGHVGSAASASVKDEYQRRCLPIWQVRWHVQKVHAIRTVYIDVMLRVGCRILRARG